MAASDSPTVARRRVRLALREAREAAELTQLHVAEAMEWSLSKVIRIESGEVSTAPNDLRPLLGHFGIEDRAQVEQLHVDAKTSRTRQRQSWWQAPLYREYLSAPLLRLIDFEGEAVAIRYFGLCASGPRTPEYAQALTRRWDEELSEDEIRYRVEARLQRRETVLSRLDTLHMGVLLDEAVLMRPVGGDAVFAVPAAGATATDRKGVRRHPAVPFEVEATLSNNAVFDLLYLGADDENAVMYRETGVSDEIVEDQVMATRHRARYEKLWQAATDQADTAAFIEERWTSVDASSLRTLRPMIYGPR